MTFPSIKKGKKKNQEKNPFHNLLCFSWKQSESKFILKCPGVLHAKQLSFCFSWPLKRVLHGTSQLWSLPVPKEYSLSM